MLPKKSQTTLKHHKTTKLRDEPHNEYKKWTALNIGGSVSHDCTNIRDSLIQPNSHVRTRVRQPRDHRNMSKDDNVPYQRVSVSGIHVTGVPLEDLMRSATLLIQALKLRKEYMVAANQSVPEYLENYLRDDGESRRSLIFSPTLTTETSTYDMTDNMATQYLNLTCSSEEFERPSDFIFTPKGSEIQMNQRKISIESLEDLEPESEPLDPWACRIPPNRNFIYKWVGGVVTIYRNKADVEAKRPLPFGTILFKKFTEDMEQVEAMVSDGPLKSYCYRRLCYLSSKFKMHALLNELHELALQKAVPHRDFYNVRALESSKMAQICCRSRNVQQTSFFAEDELVHVPTRKVDTHVHAASCMNQKHLLRFIKRTLRQYPDEVVTVKDGVPTTLKTVFQDMQLEAYDLNVDILDVHADRNTFHRFDKFNAKYNPVGESTLREVFLKTDNYMNGKYFAELLKEVMEEYKDNKYSYAEPRISIYCKNPEEWNKLATWAIKHKVYSPHVRWMVQVPRLYDIYRYAKLLKNFQQFLSNLFDPLFEVSIDPGSNPDLHKFLTVIGFDSVDDETKPEFTSMSGNMKTPEEWDEEENPPYAYYLYFMYANISVLNQIRKEQGMNLFVLRPHCGEAGPPSHLSIGFLLSENISHGLMLRKFPVLQYLYFLAQIYIAMSPLSNNSLFLRYHRNPLPEFFARGLKVTLSTDDPLQFHFTKEALMEEYSIAAQAWKLSSCDMCELALNSVIMSGFPHESKQLWLGQHYMRGGTDGNDITRTNVPDVRVSFRQETLFEELDNLFRAPKSEISRS